MSNPDTVVARLLLLGWERRNQPDSRYSFRNAIFWARPLRIGEPPPPTKKKGIRAGYERSSYNPTHVMADYPSQAWAYEKKLLEAGNAQHSRD
jgi:hypothetical protein